MCNVHSVVTGESILVRSSSQSSTLQPGILPVRSAAQGAHPTSQLLASRSSRRPASGLVVGDETTLSLQLLRSKTFRGMRLQGGHIAGDIERRRAVPPRRRRPHLALPMPVKVAADTA